MRPLDIVRTPGGGIAVITETNGVTASIDYITGCNPKEEHNAWWNVKDLKVLDSIPAMLANRMAHPFGDNKKQGTKFFRQ